MAQLTGSLNDRGELLGLLLDFDGTVAETERLGHRVAYNQAFAQLGLHWTWTRRSTPTVERRGGKERLSTTSIAIDPNLATGTMPPSIV